MKQHGLYKGFSMHEYVKNRTFSLTDIDLVKMDILNFIYTPIGSRLQMPWFGTSIPNLLFNPLDDITLAEIEAQLTKAIDYDPRVRMLDLTITPDLSKNTVVAAIQIEYVELYMKDVVYLNMSFEQSSI